MGVVVVVVVVMVVMVITVVITVVIVIVVVAADTKTFPCAIKIIPACTYIYSYSCTCPKMLLSCTRAAALRLSWCPMRQRPHGSMRGFGPGESIHIDSLPAGCPE